MDPAHSVPCRVGEPAGWQLCGDADPETGTGDWRYAITCSSPREPRPRPPRTSHRPQMEQESRISGCVTAVWIGGGGLGKHQVTAQSLGGGWCGPGGLGYGCRRYLTGSAYQSASTP